MLRGIWPSALGIAAIAVVIESQNCRRLADRDGFAPDLLIECPVRGLSWIQSGQGPDAFSSAFANIPGASHALGFYRR